ncbi:MAG: SIMPL domain-containing protein [Flavobacteriaceae bacterium]|jgi:uncharacterized protein YggE|nr:SIMPL domain-containing protein [Flavobacteriaceae bacterium]
MKKLTLACLALFAGQTLFGQVSGNINYDSGNINYQNKIVYPDNNINVGMPSSSDIVISVKGLANVKADTYVAIFSVTQVGKTTEEVNDLIDNRISKPLAEIKYKKNVETYVDMISFVPVYEMEAEKKIFSRKTYNEVPKGFELKKNIHIKYTDPAQLNDIITILSKNEIYDLVRVDYFSENLENIKKELMNRAKTVVQEKTKNYETLLGETSANAEKGASDAYKIMLPVEMYKSYEAYNSSNSLDLRKPTYIQRAEKSTTLYYQPIIDKEFDFVINPTIVEPVIQVMYEIKVLIHKEKKQPQNKEYILITPNGDMKNLNLGK